ncbi:hypothetical protein EP331_02065 [bacterium]|nr:MAG: hypothetical protein EP331_02065 [bacterium]
MKVKSRSDITHFVLLNVLLCGILVCASGWIDAIAQPVSLIRYRSDTTSVVKRDLAFLVSRPFNHSQDSLLKNLNVLMAYEAYSYDNAIDYTTPIDKRVDIYTHKAQAEWLLGMFKLALLEHYIKMESGALPLLEKSVGHLDSTIYYYGKTNRYVLGQSLLVNRVDSAFAKIVLDDLKGYVNRMEQEQNMDALYGFNLKSRAEELFDTIRKGYKDEFINQSLTYWIMLGLKDESEPILIDQK